jgi:deazaflavin-dependent oxidoreductase (nitroreductase family)
MPSRKNDLEDRLSRHRELTLTVTGRKPGRAISIAVWFVRDENKLYLLPVSGSDTQWYKNVLKNPSIQIEAGGAKAQLKLTALTESKQISAVVDKFRAKYGRSDVKKYYAKFDVAAVAQLS